MAREVKVPDIGDFDEVDVVEVLVQEGDTVAKDQALITLESDKASMEVPSTAAGKVVEVKVKRGDKIAAGAVIVVLEGDDATDDDEAKPAADAAPADDDEADDEPAGDDETDEEPAGGGTVEVTVPDMGDFDAVDVIEVLVQEGDTVAKDQALVTLESDKASMEVPSSAAGTVQAVKVARGDKVSSGDVIVVLAGAADGASKKAPKRAEAKQPAPTKKPAEKEKAATKPEAAKATPRDEGTKPGRLGEEIDEKAFADAYASPAVRRLARQLGVDLGRVEGSGRKGRITDDDVHAYVRRALAGRGGAEAGGSAGVGGFQWPQMPQIDFAQFGEVEVVEMSRIRKVAARNLHRSWLHVPHVTQFEEADVTDLEAFRDAMAGEAEKRGIKLTPLAFLLKAVAAALREHPTVNASLDTSAGQGGEKLVLKKYVHVGVAVDTENGLVVPVIRDVDQKGLFQLAEEVIDAARRARAGKLTPKDFQGGCFSISSLGGIGGTAFTPIVNAPEVAILGVSRNYVKPVWDDEEGAFEPRTMMPLSFSYDHRVVDGALGARFVVTLARVLGDVRRLLL